MASIGVIGWTMFPAAGERRVTTWPSETWISGKISITPGSTLGSCISVYHAPVAGPGRAPGPLVPGAWMPDPPPDGASRSPDTHDRGPATPDGMQRARCSLLSVHVAGQPQDDLREQHDQDRDRSTG